MLTNTVLYKKDVGTVFDRVKPSSFIINRVCEVNDKAGGLNAIKYGPHVFLVQNGICQHVILLLAVI